MAKTVSMHTPKYRRQESKPHDRAFVELNGRRRYLGRYGSRASKESYHRLVAEWTAGGGQVAVVASELAVIELIAQFWKHVETYYRRPDGTQTDEVGNFRMALRPARELYGQTPAAEFGPIKLRTVRQAMVDKGWARTNINKNVSRIKLMFRWAAENELVSPDVWHGLQAVTGLRRGRSEARESEPVRPVPEEHVDAVLRHLRLPVRAMVKVIRLTGVQGQEVRLMCECDLDMTGEFWIYKPGQHKTAHHGHERTIILGPRAQAIIRPFLKPDTQAFLFSPADATEAMRKERSEARETPIHHGNQPGSNRKRRPKRKPRDHYTRASFARAITRACEKADVSHWYPHQLRHNVGTRLRRDHGIDLAQTILGHRLGSSITEIYAEANLEKSREVIAKIG